MSLPNSAGFRFLGERVRHRGFFFSLVTGTFLDPKGYTFEREIVRHPGAVCVVALDRGAVLMVRQYRGAIGADVLEIPAGKLDIPGEELEVAARRELAEEVGRESTQMTCLGSFYNSPGFTDERTTCFLAEELSVVGHEAHGIEEEYMAVVPIPLVEFWPRVQKGEIEDAKTIIALALAERELFARRAG